MNTHSMNAPINRFNKKALSTLILSMAVFTTSLTVSNVALADQSPNLAMKSTAANAEQVEVTMVDLNKSTLAQLLTLKGIGEKKAQAILAYRDQFGGFSSIEELVNIKGVGEKILNDNKERLKI